MLASKFLPSLSCLLAVMCFLLLSCTFAENPILIPFSLSGTQPKTLNLQIPPVGPGNSWKIRFTATKEVYEQMMARREDRVTVFVTNNSNAAFDFPTNKLSRSYHIEAKACVKVFEGSVYNLYLTGRDGYGDFAINSNSRTPIAITVEIVPNIPNTIRHNLSIYIDRHKDSL